MKNIKTLFVIAGLAVACLTAKADPYYHATLVNNLTLVTNFQTVNYVTNNTNTVIGTRVRGGAMIGAGGVEIGIPTNVFRIRPGQPISFKATVTTTNNSAGVTTFTLKTTTSLGVPDLSTRWDNINKITFGLTQVNTGEQVLVTNFSASAFGGANWGVVASVASTHTNSTTATLESGSY